MEKALLTNNGRIFSTFELILGCAIGASSYPLFLTPNHIAPGGLTGVTTVINYIFPSVPVGMSSLLLNVPLFLIGWKYMGRMFVFRSAITVLLFSVLIDLLPIPTITSEPILASLYGGVILGIGIGLIMRSGATTGGTDMAARMLHKHIPHVSVGTILFSIDCVSVALAAIFIDIQYALYAFITIFVSGKVIDRVLKGGSHKQACFIISSKYEDLKKVIITTINRGVTVINARGGYSGDEHPVLLCVLSAQETSALKALVRKHDTNAFLFTTDAQEVLGEGFRQFDEEI